MSQQAEQTPTVSFIVASYNYERFIGTTLQSILAQTIKDLEVVVVDDASTDRSVEVVRSFADPRIRIHVNESNKGPIHTYNKAFEATRGAYVSYLDADNWIEPEKVEAQLTFFRNNPKTDIVGTYAKFIDHTGGRHPQADHFEGLFNQPHELNDLATWTGWNKLVASSAMLPRAVHERIGARDTTMALASDFELWTRARALGCRFGVVPRPLLAYRLHDQAAGQRDPLTNFLELSYLLQKNILPAIEAGEALPLISELVRWHVTQPQFTRLGEDQRFRLLGLLLGPQRFTDCKLYKELCLQGSDPNLLALGRRFYAVASLGPPTVPSDLEELQLQLAVRDRDLAWRDNELAARDRDIAWLNNELDVRARDIAWRDAEIARRDRALGHGGPSTPWHRIGRILRRLRGDHRPSDG